MRAPRALLLKSFAAELLALDRHAPFRETMMHLFGEPDSPRKNLWGGAVLLALSSFALGMALNELLSRPATSTDYINLLVWIAMLFIAVSQLRLGLVSVPKGPEKNDQKQRDINGSAV